MHWLSGCFPMMHMDGHTLVFCMNFPTTKFTSLNSLSRILSISMHIVSVGFRGIWLIISHTLYRR
jgi:hypothetical protein